MTSQAGFLAYAALQLAVIGAVFVALCDLCKRLFGLTHVPQKWVPVLRKRTCAQKKSEQDDDSKKSHPAPDLLAFCGAVLALGVLGYAMFWIAYASYTAYGVAKIAVLAALLIWFVVLAVRRRLSDYRFLIEPLLYATLFAAIVITLGFSNGGLGNIETFQRRFSQPLPQDNLIPWIVAETLKAGRIPSPLFGDWLMGDRPPLQTGLYLLLTLQRHELAYAIIASWLQASYLFGVWGLAVAARLPTHARRLTLLACCLLPTAIINTFFTWPKMLSVDFLLLVFALLFCLRPTSNADSDAGRKTIGVLIGGLTALALLSHGSSLFVLIGFTVVVLAFWAWPPLKSMIYGAAALAALYVPWMAFQAFVDPPSNRLLKWHFAGVTEVDGRSFLTALSDSYGALSWHDYLQGRLVNVITMIGTWPQSLADLTLVVARQDTNEAVVSRGTDFFQLLPSLHYFAIAVICALALLAFPGGEYRAQRRIALRLFVAAAAGSVAVCMLIFIPGQAVNHQGSYATQVMLTVFAFVVLSLRAPVLAVIFILAQAASVATVYAFTLPRDPAMWAMQALCAAATLVIVAYSFWPRVSVLILTAYEAFDDLRDQTARASVIGVMPIGSVALTSALAVCRSTLWWLFPGYAQAKRYPCKMLLVSA